MNDNDFDAAIEEVFFEDREDIEHWRNLQQRFCDRKPTENGAACAEDLEAEAAWLLISRLSLNKLGEDGVGDLFNQSGRRLDKNRGRDPRARAYPNRTA